MRRFLHLASRGFLFLGLLLAWVQPARADFTGFTVQYGSVLIAPDRIQFSFMWGAVAREISAPANSQVTVSVTVDNTQTNTIGWIGATADEWRITLASGQEAVQVSGNQIRQTQETLSLTIPEDTESATLRIEGVDRGFWAGFYGPAVTNVQIDVSEYAQTTTTVATTTTQPEETTTIPETTTTVGEPSSLPTQVPTTSVNTDAPTSAPLPTPFPEVSPPVTETTPSTSSPTTTVASTTTQSPTTTEPATTEPPATEPATTLAQSPESTPGQTTEPITAPAETVPATAPAETFPASTEPDTTTTSSDAVPTTNLQALSDDDKEELEAQVNIFAGGYESYVPTGSTITVAQRRTVIAVTAVTLVLSSPLPGGRRKLK